MSEWQPIESAPTEGREPLIELYSNKGHPPHRVAVSVGKQLSDGRWCGWGYSTMEGPPRPEDQPTHWRIFEPPADAYQHFLKGRTCE